jgi:O-antigen/teichoic acid export membrane protein
MKSLRNDISWTVITQVAVVSSLFLQYRIVSHQWGIEALSSYSIVSRARGALEWIILMVLPLATARCVSFTEDSASKWAIAFTSILSGVFLLILSAGSCLLFRGTAAQLLFGTISLVSWVVPFCSLLLAYSFFLLISGVLRGFLEFRISNGINVISIAIVPTICLMGGGKFRLVDVVTFLGLFSFTTTALLFLVFLSIKKPSFSALTRERFSRDLKGLLSYGSPRLLTLACGALFTMVLPWLLSRRGDINMLAILNSMMAIVSGSTFLTASAGFVLFPHLSRSFAAGDKKEAARLLGPFLYLTLYIGLAGSIICLGFIEDLLQFWLGIKIPNFDILFFATSLIIPAFLLIDILRSPIDAASNIPWNAVTYFLGFSVCTLTYFGLVAFGSYTSEIVCSFSLIAGFVVAGATSLVLTSKLYGMKHSTKGNLFIIMFWALEVFLLKFAIIQNYSKIVVNIASLVFVALLAISIFLVKPLWYQRLLEIKLQK